MFNVEEWLKIVMVLPIGVFFTLGICGLVFLIIKYAIINPLRFLMRLLSKKEAL
jgi:hypothetical protein